MSAEKKVPAIRFEGFSGEWEDSELGSVVSYVKGYAFKSSDYKFSGARIIRVSDLMKDTVSESSNKIYISIDKEKIYSKYKINSGDIVVTTVGSKAHLRESAVGRAIIFNVSKNFLLNQNLVKITPLEGNDSQFIYSQLNREQYAKYIEDVERGNANQANIAMSDLWKYSFCFPENKNEQTKIGSYFQQLDTLITQHQQKHDKLLNMKKALLEKMFPKQNTTEPEIRFKGFSGEWENRKLLENFTKIIDFRGRTPKKLGLDWSETGYLALSALNVKNGFIDFSVDAHFGDQELYEKWMLGNELHNNQVLFTTEAPMGNVAQIPDDKKYILSQRTIAFEVNPKLIEESFLAVTLRSPELQSKFTSLSSGGTAQGVSQKALATVNMISPSCITEQTKIGKLFQQLDTLINQHQTQLKKLNNIKQACLEKMFV